VREEKENRAAASKKEGVSAKKTARKEGGVVVEDDGKQLRKRGKEKKGGKKSAKKELPFVIDAPQTLELFRAIVDGRSDAELALAVERIRACNSVNLAAENRRKMQVRKTRLFVSISVVLFSIIFLFRR
jgi:nucleolar protein 14